MEIGIEKIVVKSNPRTDFGDLTEMAASVQQKGIIEPLVVKKVNDNKFELIAGERRLRAAKAVGLESVPVSVYSGDESDIEEIKVIENIQRKDLNPFEEGVAFKRLMDESKMSVETLSEKVSKPKIYVERRLAILGLCDQAKKSVFDGKLLLGHALLISRFDICTKFYRIKSFIHLQQPCKYQPRKKPPMCENNHHRPNLALIAVSVVP